MTNTVMVFWTKDALCGKHTEWAALGGEPETIVFLSSPGALELDFKLYYRAYDAIIR